MAPLTSLQVSDARAFVETMPQASGRKPSEGVINPIFMGNELEFLVDSGRGRCWAPHAPAVAGSRLFPAHFV